jgi:hypothetical protein
MKSKKICLNCIYDENIPNISFSEDGVCNYCDQIEFLKNEFGTGRKKGQKLLKRLIESIKRDGKDNRYNCVVGVSGGTDSSYLLMKTKEWGLSPLAVHYDNTWNSAVASINIQKVTKSLDVDLYTHVVNNVEVDDIKLSFLKSGVPEFDADTDIAFVQVLREAAAKYKIKYILEGHSFTEEGISPIGSNYLDGAYVNDIHKKYGSMKSKTFPNMTFYQFMKWIIFFRQKFIRPLWYINYSKNDAIEELTKKTGWQYYGGHHLENRASSFSHTIWLPRYGIDFRYLSLAAKVRKNKLFRKEALKIFNSDINIDKRLVKYVKKRLRLTDIEYSKLITGKKRSWRDFNTNKKIFELLRPLFYILMKLNRVPISFYLKYCFKIKE